MPKILALSILALILCGYGLAATVRLAWDTGPEPDIAGYNLYRSTSAGSAYSRVNASLIRSTSYADPWIDYDRTYYYRVSAVNSAGLESEPSSPVSVKVASSNPSFQSVNQAPIIEMPPGQVVRPRERVSLTASAWDPQGRPLSYHWTQLSGPQVQLDRTDRPSVRFFAPDTSQELLLSFRLTVSDGLLTSHATVNVSVSVEDMRVVTSALVVPVTVEESGSRHFDDTFVGVAVFNPNDFVNEIALANLRSGGRLVGNRVARRSLGRWGQNSFLAHEVTPAGRMEGVLRAEGVDGPVQGFFMIGDYDLNRLDGIGGRLAESTELYFPMVRHSHDASTRFFLFNPSAEETARLQVLLFSAAGDVLREVNLEIEATGSLNRSFANVFGDDLALQEGYGLVRSDLPLRGFALYAVEAEFSAVPGQVPSTRRELVAPHFFTDTTGGNTELRLLNYGQRSVRVDLEAFDDRSRFLGGTTFEIESGRLYVSDVVELLGINADGSSTVTGHLRLRLFEEDGSGVAKPAPVMAMATFVGNNGRFHSTLPLIAEGDTEKVFLHVAQSRTMEIFTGFAILNAGEAPATVDVEAYDKEGRLTAGRRLHLQPGHRVVDLLDGERFFGSSFEQVNGHVRVLSSEPVVTFALFGDFQQNYLSAIEGQQPIRHD